MRCPLFRTPHASTIAPKRRSGRSGFEDDVEALVMQVLVALDVDRHADLLLELFHEASLFPHEGAVDLRMDAQHERVRLPDLDPSQDLAADLEGDRRNALRAA